MTSRFWPLVALILGCQFFAGAGRAEVLSSAGWSIDDGNGATGVVFVGPSYQVVLPYPSVTYSQGVSLFSGQYSLTYKGDPLVISSGPGVTEITLTPSISTAGDGTPLVSTTVNALGSFDYLSATPHEHTDSSFHVTSSGAAVVSFAFVAANCSGSIADQGTYGLCAGNFDPASVTLTLLSLDTLSSRLGGGMGGNVGNVAGSLDQYAATPSSYPSQFLGVFGLSNSSLSAGLAQLSGEAITGGAHGGFQLMRNFFRSFAYSSGASRPNNQVSFATERASALPADALAYV